MAYPTRPLGSLFCCDAAAAVDAVAGPGAYRKFPYALRILAENVARSDGLPERRDAALAALAARSREVDLRFWPGRVVLQDLLGTPALVDLAGMRDAVGDRGGDPSRINPVVPVQLVVDHSINVDRWGDAAAHAHNLAAEQRRNAERFAFLSWCGKAFRHLTVIPSGTGILHQINLERLSPVIATMDTLAGRMAFPDTVVGTDSHTTMINALGVLGWGVGGIEAEAAMLGQPLVFRIPETVAVRLRGRPAAGVLATDIVLALTEMLRGAGVIGALLEFHGPAAASLSVADRATIANMAPEFGATAALFPPDARTIEYLQLTGRPAETRELVRAYIEAQGLSPAALADAEFERTIEFDLSAVRRAIAGPRHPHQLRELGRPGTPLPAGTDAPGLPDGAVVIAAITACTNTSNPRAVVAAALLARNARRRGLAPARWTKTSFAPGSRVVADYLARATLDQELDALGFNVVGFGCTTCNGMSGPLHPEVAEAIIQGGVTTAAVLSGNRNFEGRIHPLAREAYIMSPPLVVAYALAGHVRLDPENDPLTRDATGAAVFLRELWPSDKEIDAVVQQCVSGDAFARAYADVTDGYSPAPPPALPPPPRYPWNPDSTYIRKPPYWDEEWAATDPVSGLRDLRLLAMLGDHVTTDHISPSGAIPLHSAAGRYLHSHGVAETDFNSYGTRRGNHEVALRATFANPRLCNELADGREGSLTRLLPNGEIMELFAAAEIYARRGQGLVIIAGREYGTGSSRDWAAKGPWLLGVRLVVAESFERIHRANLAGVGILPAELPGGISRRSLDLTGRETFDVEGAGPELTPGGELRLIVRRPNGATLRQSVRCRLDTAEELGCFRAGGLLRLLAEQPS